MLLNEFVATYPNFRLDKAYDVLILSGRFTGAATVTCQIEPTEGSVAGIYIISFMPVYSGPAQALYQECWQKVSVKYRGHKYRYDLMAGDCQYKTFLSWGDMTVPELSFHVAKHTLLRRKFLISCQKSGLTLDCSQYRSSKDNESL